MGYNWNVYTALVGKPKGKTRLEGTRRNSQDNIKMDLREVGWDGMGWVHLIQGRALVNMVESS
jgi:hypothetical protein